MEIPRSLPGWGGMGETRGAVWRGLVVSSSTSRLSHTFFRKRNPPSPPKRVNDDRFSLHFDVMI